MRGRGRIFWQRWLAVALVASLTGCDRSPPAAPQRVAPELEGGLTWLNSPPLKLAELRGKVVLVDFFEYSCVNCLRTLPYQKEWQRRYADHGLVIIGVHTPQYGFSMDPHNVFQAVKRLGITYPVVVDSNFKIADAYGNRFWPRKFLIDRRGRIRFDHTGEGAYVVMERTIQELLHELHPRIKFPAPMAPLEPTDRDGVVCYPVTPELYLGQERGRLDNPEATKSTDPVMFTAPKQPASDSVYAVGQWANQSEYLRHTRDTEVYEDFLALNYRATEVNVVMKPEDVYWMKILVKQDEQPLRREVAGADVLFDGDGQSYVKVDGARMYNLVAKQPYGTHELRLYPQTRGLSVYSFSFGTCEMPADAKRLQQAQENK